MPISVTTNSGEVYSNSKVKKNKMKKFKNYSETLEYILTHILETAKEKGTTKRKSALFNSTFVFFKSTHEKFEFALDEKSDAKEIKQIVELREEFFNN